eukprot:m51a1_g5086 hypothetical protein (85) ;mRNA; r:255249-255619
MATTFRHPTLADLKWRVDVAVSTSASSRVMAPVILMEMTTSEGKVWTFEVPVDKFHELRYNVARVLKDVEELDQLPILKIDSRS